MFSTIGVYNPKIYRWIFFLLLAIVFCAYFYPEILFLRPAPIHLWRQSDCLSFTLNYYKENRNFLEPSIHQIGWNDNGKTISEFPIIYFLVAQLWKIFGQQDFIFRLVNMLLLFSGLFSFFKFCQDILKDSVWAIMITLFLFSSPILAYYGNTFLADVPALSMVLSGWYYFWKFYTSEKNRWLWIASGFFMMGVLLKASAAISIICVCSVFALEFLGIMKFKIGEKLFKRPLKQVWPLLFVIISVLSWYAYVSHYNKVNNQGFFLVGILPMWELNHKAIVEVGRIFLHELMPEYFNPSAFPIVLCMFFLLIIFRKKTFSFLFTSMIISSVCFLIFIFLFFQVFNAHDYYLINMLVFVALVILTFSCFLKQNHPAVFKKTGLRILFGLLIAFCIYNTSLIQRAKYFRYANRENYSFLLPQKQMEFCEWSLYAYEKHLKALETITPYLRSIGVNREDKVLSIPDPSINISLALMDQKGWTDYGKPDFESFSFDNMKYLILHNAKYLILNDTSGKFKDFFRPFISKKIGEYQNIQIFLLSDRIFKNLEGESDKEKRISYYENCIFKNREWYEKLWNIAITKKYDFDSVVRVNAAYMADQESFGKSK